jgi:ferrous iron transport protein A
MYRAADPGSVDMVATAASPSPSIGAARAMSMIGLPRNRLATVVALVDSDGNDAGVANRLAELGFVPGETVCVLHHGPGGREPIAVQVGDTVFALRRREADCVRVEPLS